MAKQNKKPQKGQKRKKPQMQMQKPKRTKANDIRRPRSITTAYGPRITRAYDAAFQAMTSAAEPSSLPDPGVPHVNRTNVTNYFNFSSTQLPAGTHLFLIPQNSSAVYWFKLSSSGVPTYWGLSTLDTFLDSINEYAPNGGTFTISSSEASDTVGISALVGLAMHLPPLRSWNYESIDTAHSGNNMEMSGRAVTKKPFGVPKYGNYWVPKLINRGGKTYFDVKDDEKIVEFATPSTLTYTTDYEDGWIITSSFPIGSDPTQQSWTGVDNEFEATLGDIKFKFDLNCRLQTSGGTPANPMYLFFDIFYEFEGVVKMLPVLLSSFAYGTAPNIYLFNGQSQVDTQLIMTRLASIPERCSPIQGWRLRLTVNFTPTSIAVATDTSAATNDNRISITRVNHDDFLRSATTLTIICSDAQALRMKYRMGIAYEPTELQSRINESVTPVMLPESSAKLRRMIEALFQNSEVNSGLGEKHLTQGVHVVDDPTNAFDVSDIVSALGGAAGSVLGVAKGVAGQLAHKGVDVLFGDDRKRPEMKGHYPPLPTTPPPSATQFNFNLHEIKTALEEEHPWGPDVVLDSSGRPTVRLLAALFERPTNLPLGKYLLHRPLLQPGRPPVTHCYVIFTDDDRKFSLHPTTQADDQKSAFSTLADDYSTAVGYKDNDYLSADVLQWCWDDLPLDTDMSIQLFGIPVFIGQRVLSADGSHTPTAYPPTPEMIVAVQDMNKLFQNNPHIFEVPLPGEVLTLVANAKIQGGSATPALFVLLTDGDPNVVVTGTTGLLDYRDEMNLLLPRFPPLTLRQETDVLRRKAIIVNDPSTPYSQLLAVAPAEISVAGVTCVNSYSQIYNATRKRGA
jgi:hypothetical protein